MIANDLSNKCSRLLLASIMAMVYLRVVASSIVVVPLELRRVED